MHVVQINTQHWHVLMCMAGVLVKPENQIDLEIQVHTLRLLILFRKEPT